MKNNYDVSIVFPIYNVEKYVEESLLSALNQTFQSIEYILVDDCGSDASMKVVENIVKTHPRQADVKIICHEKNKGISEARNTGIANASGRYIFFLDSDDEIIENCIELHYDIMLKSTPDFTIGLTELVNKSSIHIKNINFESKESDAIFESFFKREWLASSACNKLYNRDYIIKNKISFIPNIFYEDVAWGFDIVKSAQRISMVNEYTYIYKIRGNSTTTSLVSESRLNDALYMMNYIYDYRNNINKSLEKHFYRYISFLKFNHSLILLKSDLSEAKQEERFRALKDIKTPNANNIYSMLLALNYWCFKTSVSIPYYLYKKFQ